MKPSASIASIAVVLLVAAALAWAGSDGSVDAGGLPAFVWCGLLAFVINWVVFVPSYLQRSETFFDLTGSITYLSVMALALVLADDLDARSILVSAMVAAWALRLGTFLFRRIRADGKDGRFDQIKTNFWQLLLTWTLQGLWVYLTAAAAIAIVVAGERRSFGVWAALGFVVWLGGWLTEVIADQQKSRFKANPANAGRYITSGLWSWSRHPNYFGEIVLWTGIAIMAVPVLSGWGWAVLISPVFVFTLLTRISGIPMLARRGRQRWGDEPEYLAYLERTSLLVPLPPRRP
ncbi:MAG: DUF1295 domain-containing protein [Actinomycetota bacterium]